MSISAYSNSVLRPGSGLYHSAFTDLHFVTCCNQKFVSLTFSWLFSPINNVLLIVADYAGRTR